MQFFHFVLAWILVLLYIYILKIISLATKKINLVKKKINLLLVHLDTILQPTYARINYLNSSFFEKFTYKLSWLPNYYSRNENLWVDGFLFDFLQKKTIDSWIRQWVIYTGFLFSERLVFDSVVRLYLDNIIWPLHDRSIFEVSNTSEMLITTIFLYFTMLILFFSLYIVYLI